MPIYPEFYLHGGQTPSYASYFNPNVYSSFSGYSRALNALYSAPPPITRSTYVGSSSSRYKPILTTISEGPLIASARIRGSTTP